MFFPQDKAVWVIFYARPPASARAPISSAADVLCPSRALMYRTVWKQLPSVEKGLDFTVENWGLQFTLYKKYIKI